MAIAGLGVTYRSQIHIRNPIFRCLRKAWPSSVAAIEAFEEAEDCTNWEIKQWKKLNPKELGISTSKINKPTRKVLNNLKQKGYEVYLVGGCVRDLLLKRTPKDFDIITSAELKEVSSFSTCHNRVDGNSSHHSELPTAYDEKDYGRWRNCLQRDFTINGFMFDPYASIVYDYLGGIEDLREAKLRTVIPADTSFQEDSARILRAIRIAARLGFRISRETAHFVKNDARLVLRLGKGRLLMEVNYMLAYGSAEASLRLLWKFGLLELLLPIQAAYFVRTGFRRRDKRSNMLLSLFSNMDKLLAPDKPCHSSLWVAILAFHKALYDQPRDPLVVAAFSLAVHNGGDISEAIEIATRITTPHDVSFRELLDPQNMESEALKDQVMDLADSVRCALHGLTDEQVVSWAMAQYSKAPFSDLVLVSLGLYLRVCRIFECVRGIAGQVFRSKQGSKINYESLALGAIEEVRHVFARIVFDTVYPLKLTNDDSK